jgi:hypothetical protein
MNLLGDRDPALGHKSLIVQSCGRVSQSRSINNGWKFAAFGDQRYYHISIGSKRHANHIPGPRERLGAHDVDIDRLRWGGPTRVAWNEISARAWLDAGVGPQRVVASMERDGKAKGHAPSSTMALALEPAILIADEPTTALDVTTQAQILALIKQIQAARQMGMLFITHDFGVVAEIADRAAVMRQGEIVEYGPAARIFGAPQHAYTQELLAAIPGRNWAGTA